MSTLSAIVVAAGGSTRFLQSADQRNLKTPSKPFVVWEGKPLIRHTLEALSRLPLQEIMVVVRAEDKMAMADSLAGISVPIRFAAGGLRRQDSVRAGLAALRASDFVAVHDGARPFLGADFLFSLWQRAQQVEAIIPAMPVVETLKEIDEQMVVVRTHPRSRFVRVQTPQIFKSKILMEAHERFASSDREFTDDAAMVEALGEKVYTFAGSAENIKVTTVEDLKGRVHGY